MRKPFCQHYATCLDHHARQGTDFHCNACPRYRPTPYHATVADIAGSLALLLALECPDQYSALAGRPGFRVMLLRSMVAVLHPDDDFS